MMKHYKRLFPAAMALLLATALTACAPAQPNSGKEGSSSSTSSASSQSGPDYDALLAGLPENSTPSFANFTTLDIDGKEATHEVLAKADLTMVNIWATFCGPCISEMPELGEISHEYKDKGLQIIGIVSDVQNRDGSISNKQIDIAKEIIGKTGADYLHLLPSYDLFRAKLSSVLSVPETVFLDKDGKQVGKSYLGARSKEEWTAIIDQLLQGVQGA